jgi:acetyltransferase-like isoleucine patch superfamily enzyme
MLKNVLKRIIYVRNGFRKIHAQYIGVYNDKAYGKKGGYSIVANNSSINQKNIYLDDYCIVQSQTNFISNKGKLIVKKYSVISSGCIIVPESHKLTVGVPFYLSTINHINDDEGDIIIDEDCWIGAGCILLPKCHIGRGAVVGAGSVVKKEVSPYAVVVGAPARVVAVKFTIEEILRHEAVLYPPEERLSEEYLRDLFKEKYQNLKSIGVDDLCDEEKIKLSRIREKLGMKDYSNTQIKKFE